MMLCAATFLYYFILFSAYKVDLLTIMTSILKYHKARNDLSLLVFPREVACIWKMMGASGTMEAWNFHCKINNNEHNEQLHVIAFFVSIAVLVLYYLNTAYIAFTFAIVNSKDPTAKHRYVWRKLSYRKRLVMILIQNNIDSLTYEKVFNKVCDGQLTKNTETFQMQLIRQVPKEQTYISML